MSELVLKPAHSTWRLAIAVVLAVAATLGVMALARGHEAPATSGHVYRAPGHAFAIAYPAGWLVHPQSRIPGSPLLALQSADRRSLVVVRQTTTPGNETLAQLAAQLTAQLKRKFADFKAVSARVAQTRGGAAFLYTFARTKADQVQSIMVTRVNGRAYALYAVAPASDPAAARQAGLVLGTFGR